MTRLRIFICMKSRIYSRHSVANIDTILFPKEIFVGSFRDSFVLS